MEADSSLKVVKKSSKKATATKVSMTVAFVLAVTKATVGFMTGSLSVLSSAVDSILDILSSFFNFIAIRKAEEPADSEHEFGHGKYESLAAFIQSLIIFATGLMILVSAWNRFTSGEHSQVGILSIWVMVFSIIATICLTIYLRHRAKTEQSTVLEADAMHYAVDLYTNIGILVALIVMKYTGLTFIDPIVAAVVAVYIIYSALRLSLDVSKVLLDSKIEAETYNKLVDVLNSFDCYHKDFHRLRTRSSGKEKFIDMHMTLCSKLTLGEVHCIIDAIEDAIRKEIPDADITIHPEPCDHDEELGGGEDCNSVRVRLGLDVIKQRSNK